MIDLPVPDTPVRERMKLPLFLDLKGRDCLLVGGNGAAEAKARLLIRCGARINLIAETLSPQLLSWIQQGKARHFSRRFSSSQLDRQALVVITQCAPELTRHIREMARARSIPCNVMDQPDLCDFYFPSIVDRSPVMIAISTDGTAPVLARQMRDRLERALPPTLGPLARCAGQFRSQVKRVLSRFEDRRAFWEQYFSNTGLLDRPLNDHELHRRMITLLHRFRDEPSVPAGRLYLIDNPTRDLDRLTLRSLRRIQRADTILIDSDSARDISELARRDARLIHLGETPVRCITELMRSLAAEGQEVIRYKDRHSRLFGATNRELEQLQDHDCQLEQLGNLPNMEFFGTDRRKSADR